MANLDISRLYPTDLYTTDYVQWIESTVAKLRRQDYGAVDWQNLIEEIEDMGRSERKSLKSNFIVILLHLLKWQYQPPKRSGSWAGSIVEHRRRVRDAIADSPSLKPYLQESYSDWYGDAVRQAIAETQLDPETFPAICSYTLSEILDFDFLPRT
ncbi:MAG: DUF29 domain-containing protein [Leptolyngbyaceae cyanobacterium CSU_1_4]|nr:DUF29 domain-containing protein [Leptolyngbyaceae cyanobacterium CSU_1_4]